ncbi:hypothetical protein TYRP_004782 [Tyrophagus putrescentiae]|nr:hypothetical protein TYRP_004782 [Tyrophagus putrescentiae]
MVIETRTYGYCAHNLQGFPQDSLIINITSENFNSKLAFDALTDVRRRYYKKEGIKTCIDKTIVFSGYFVESFPSPVAKKIRASAMSSIGSSCFRPMWVAGGLFNLHKVLCTRWRFIFRQLKNGHQSLQQRRP